MQKDLDPKKGWPNQMDDKELMTTQRFACLRIRSPGLIVTRLKNCRVADPRIPRVQEKRNVAWSRISDNLDSNSSFKRTMSDYCNELVAKIWHVFGNLFTLKDVLMFGPANKEIRVQLGKVSKWMGNNNFGGEKKHCRGRKMVLEVFLVTIFFRPSQKWVSKL